MRKIINENDLRIVKTKNAIKSTLKQMICELPYEKITVKELANRAQINRNTFYLHYDIIDDVLVELQSEYSSKYIELIKDYNYLDNSEELVRSFFEFMEEQDEFFQIITCESKYDHIRLRMQNRVVEHTQNKTKKAKSLEPYIQNIVMTYFTMPLYLYRQWVNDGRKIPLKKVIKLATTLIQDGITGFKKQKY